MNNAETKAKRPSDEAAAMADPEFLQDLTLQMNKFATLQLGDSHQAEDAVQEALVGALKNSASFNGKAALKTWIFAILKNKIADVLRHRQRQGEASTFQDDEDYDGVGAELFDNRGNWHRVERPNNWGDPEESFKQQQFWDVLDICLNGLPAKQAKIFMMREILGLTTEELCNENRMSMSNLHVVLHRARLRLRDCLESRWFEGRAN